uniref:Enoyl reductase (ER) domain-containing protein n=1 Tax=Entomoneis paludosa TaxID=265537 RepID=A0A7S2Y7W5_9STRA
MLSPEEAQSIKDLEILRDILNAPSPNVHFALASNSPRQHVEKILHGLGLCNIPGLELFTPDCGHNQQERTKAMDESIKNTNSFPTKLRAKAFFGALLDQFSAAKELCLIDDSSTVLQAVETQTNMRTIQVSNKRSLLEAVGIALGWLDPDFAVDDCQYLKSKNVVDFDSFHRDTWASFLTETATMLQARSRAESLVVVDLGAGLLSMLRLMLGGHDHEDLPSLTSFLSQNMDALSKIDNIVYHAYEPNINLAPECIKILESLGFVQDTEAGVDSSKDFGSSTELLFYRQEQGGMPYMEVRLRLCDYTSMKDFGPSPDIILGCCFADLMEPNDLVQSTVQQFLAKPQHDQSYALAYFPITFCGTTQFLKPQPSTLSKAGVVIPSDAAAFAFYAKALQDRHGHNLDSSKLVQAMRSYGGQLLSRGNSNWNIVPSNNDEENYLWHAMMRFFGTTAAPELQKAGFDAQGWLQRARENKPTIQASNQDLLFRIPFVGREIQRHVEAASSSLSETFEEIQFTAPNKVSTVEKQTRSQTLGDTEVRIAGVCSLISSGTELKVFKGLFEDVALDVNIPSMEGERMTYPLTYGYSLVGHVVECGAAVADKENLIGKLVFAFAPHASQVVVDQSALQVVPDGVDPYDAIFLPSVETALSIVQDAHVRFGERIAVFGQGLIGLLVTAILGNMHSSIPTLTTVDSIPSRLAASTAMGSSQALLPDTVAQAAPFDVAIEVSGNSKALQTAIDMTVNHGRIIIASWYGNENVDLKLGMEFHRSHKSMIVSQVSEIPPALSGTWDKARRFALAWDLVKLIKPSKLLTKTAFVSQAQEMYTSLDNGDDIAVAFDLTARE